MNPIQKIDNNSAYHRYIRIKQLKQHTEEMMLMIGAELHVFQKEKQYLSLDYDSFEAFLGDPDIDITPRTAYRMIRIYRVFVLRRLDEMHLELEDNNKVEVLIEKDPDYVRLLIAAGVSKLDNIAGHLTESNRDYLLNMASTNSRSSLRAELTGVEYNNTESWKSLLDEVRTLCAKLAADHNAPLEVRECANEFLRQTSSTLSRSTNQIDLEY